MGTNVSKRFKADLEALHRNDPTLTVLNYEELGTGDEGARVLADALRGNRTVKRLRLGQCGLTALGLQRLCRALCDTSVTPCHLRRLDLSTVGSSQPVGNIVGDNGAKCLAALLSRCPTLRHLNASGCGIGDEGSSSIAKALAKNKNLKTLDLSNNSISDIGAEELGVALCTNHTLQGLSLWNNRVFHSGAESLANGLAANTTLTWLGLGCNYIGDEGVKAISIALISNARDSGLVWLALGGNQITDRGAEYVGVALRAQRFRHRSSRLSRGNAIKEMDDPFEDTDGPFDNDTESVPSQSSLKERIRGGGLRPMLELGVTPSHVSMLLEGEEEGVDGDGESREEGEDREKEGVEEGEGVMEEGGEEEEEDVICIPLESLGLGGNKIGDGGAMHIATGLTSNKRLLSLGLADNCIGDEGASSLADLLRQTGYLQRLYLSGNEVRDEGGSKLVAALTQNTSLKALYLARNSVGDEVGQRCLEVIGRHNNTLETLDIHDTGMTTPTINNLVEKIRNEGVLRILGSQSLPVGVVSETEPHLPLSGNILEMENWRPKRNNPILRTTSKGFTMTTAPSNRQTTLEALGSLPPPTETAQTLVVRAGRESREGTMRRSRRSSVSNFFKRKLSLSRGGSATRRSHVVVGDDMLLNESGGRHRASWRPSSAEMIREEETKETWRGMKNDEERVRVGWRQPDRNSGAGGGFIPGKRRSHITQPIELQPLIEEDIDSGMFKSQTTVVGESDFSTTSMEHVNQTTYDNSGGGMEYNQTNSDFNLIQSDMESGLQEAVPVQQRKTTMGMDIRNGMGLGLGNGMETTENNKQSHRDSILDSVQRRSMLHHLTTDRPKPPSQRRPPSRDRTPSPSPLHTPQLNTFNNDTLKEEEDEERDFFHYNAANRMIASATPIHTSEERVRKLSLDSKPTKEQWLIALRKRVGILSMGGFLHSGFQAVSSITNTHNYTIPRLPRNSAKCREGAPLPPHHSRVKLQLVFEEVGSDFINASYLGRPTYPKELIITQLPLENTVADFWRMIWEQRVSVLMVIGEEVGEGVWLWPGKGEEEHYSLVVNSSWEPEALTVTGLQMFQGTIPTLTVYQFSLSSAVDSETDYLTLYHFAGWPEGGVVQSPDHVASLVQLLLATREQQLIPAPLCVMSSKGGGRAGCMCTLVCAYQMMNDPSPEPECWEQDQNIIDQVIRGLQSGREGLVTNQRQYEFLHQILEQMMTCSEREGEGRRGREEIDYGGKASKKKSKKTKGGKKEQRKEKSVNRSKKKKKNKKEEMTDSNNLLEEDDPQFDDQLHTQQLMMY